MEVKVEAAVVATTRREVDRLPVAPDLPRALLPLETYPVSAGIKGGLAGSVAMAVLACLYGLLKQGSIWYPINLLAATVYTQSLHSWHDLAEGIPSGKLLCWRCVIHLLTSLLVGLLYGAMLPMIPRRPILLGGVVAPILWTGLLHSMLGLLNPLLNQLHQLAVVRRFAVRFRHRRGIGGGAPGAGTHPPARAVSDARRF